MNKMMTWSVISLVLALTSCKCPLGAICEPVEYGVDVTFYFINETGGLITTGCWYVEDIPAKETLVHNKRYIHDHVKPDINNLDMPFYTCSFAYEDGSILKCEDGINDIQNYENRKEVSPSVFEFTFRFTEERKRQAKPCKY